MRKLIKIIFKVIVVIPLMVFTFLLCVFPLNIFTWFCVGSGIFNLLAIPCYWMLQWDDSELSASWDYTGNRKVDMLLDATLMVWVPLYVGYTWLFDEIALEESIQKLG